MEANVLLNSVHFSQGIIHSLVKSKRTKNPHFKRTKIVFLKTNKKLNPRNKANSSVSDLSPSDNINALQKLFIFVTFTLQMIESEEIDKYMAEIDKEKEEEAEKKKSKKDKS